MSKGTTQAGREGESSLRGRVQAQWEALSASERRVAEYILGMYPQAAFATVNRVAVGANTSARSVMRFVQRLGYEGFPELQAELRADIERRLSSPIDRLRRSVETADQDDLLAVSLRQAADNLSSVAHLDPDAVRAVAHAIAGTDGSIFLFGAGKALALATYLWFELMLLRPASVLLDGGQLEVLDQLIDLSANELVIVFDFRRYPRLGSAVAALAKERGAHLVVVSDAPVSPAAIRADLVLALRTDSHSMLDSYVAGFALADVLTEMVINEIPGATLGARLNRYEVVTSQVEVFMQRGDDRRP